MQNNTFMKRIYHFFAKILFGILFIYLFSACDKKNDPIFQNNNWQTIYQNNALYLYSISFLDKTHGFVMADSAAVHGLKNWKFVLSTEDGGNTWNQKTCTTIDTVPEFPLYDIGFIHPISKNDLLATGSHVHRSINEGATWRNVSPQLVVGSVIDDLYVLDSITWLIAKTTHIYRTNNGGQTWQNVFQTDFMGALESFSFPSSDVGYINDGVVDMDHNLSAGLIVKTIDGGQSWAKLDPEPWKSNGTAMPQIKALQFITDQIGFIATYDSKLYKTLDGGSNWLLVHNNHNSNILFQSKLDTIVMVQRFMSQGMEVRLGKSIIITMFMIQKSLTGLFQKRDNVML
jgi:photosystem II stability/assembly factor-like uncharacterized protein